MDIRLFLLMLFLLSKTVLSAQQITFSKIISNYPAYSETGAAIRECSDGYLISSLEYCVFNDKNLRCCTVIKLNFSGDILWTKQFPMMGRRNNIYVDNDRIYFCLTDESDGLLKYVLFCLNQDGETLWKRSYTDNVYNYECLSLKRLNDDALILVGMRWMGMAEGEGKVIWFLQTSLEGDSLSSFYYGWNNKHSGPKDIHIDESGNIFLGFIYCHDYHNCVVAPSAVAYLTPSGEALCEQKLLSSNYLYMEPTVTELQSGVLLSANSYPVQTSFVPPAFNYFTDAGSHLFTWVYDNPLDIRVNGAVRATADGGFVACGTSAWPPTGGGSAGWIFKAHEQAYSEWDRSYSDDADAE